MIEPNTNRSPQQLQPEPTRQPSPKLSVKVNDGTGNSHSGTKAHYPNPPESINPDTATLRDQWRFAIRQYSKWYSHAWGTAILAGAAFFALGWIIKGENPLPSLHGKKKYSGSEQKGDKPSSAQSQGT